MTRKSLRWLVPFLILGCSYAAFSAITSSSEEGKNLRAAKAPPTVTVSKVQSGDHNVVITGHGEIVPVEVTRLSAQVSGEVISWHPNFVVGGIVKRGEVLFTLESENYQAAVLQAEASVASARAALIEEQAQANVAQKQAKRLPKSQVTELYLRKPQLLSAEAKVKSSLADLKRARRDLENCNIVAPYDALVVSRELGVGQFVSAGTNVATLNNIESGEIYIPIAGFDSAFIPDDFIGREAKITLQGVLAIERIGRLERDLGVVDSNTRMTNIIVSLSDPYSMKSDETPIKFGSYVEVKFIGKKLKHIYRLPQEIVNNKKVWVVNQDNILEPRIVNVLRAEKDFMLINKGLRDNDQVVLTVPDYPQEGLQVEVAKPDLGKEQ